MPPRGRFAPRSRKLSSSIHMDDKKQDRISLLGANNNAPTEKKSVFDLNLQSCGRCSFPLGSTEFQYFSTELQYTSNTHTNCNQLQCSAKPLFPIISACRLSLIISLRTLFLYNQKETDRFLCRCPCCHWTLGVPINQTSRLYTRSRGVSK